MADARKLARIFKALSAEPRVKIIQLLKGQTLCVNALAGRLGITPAAVSQHLRVLRDAGLVTPEKRGYYVHYALSAEALADWRRLAGGLLTEAE